ncbi:MAG: type IV secretory system conjugative DNA transfer family protein [Bacillota bacterium]|nr:type IV secretory system conjugative DNA transfer family protein [Bacillota bacterium]
MYEDKIMELTLRIMALLIVMIIAIIILKLIKNQLNPMGGTDNTSEGLKGSGLIRTDKPKGFIFGKHRRQKVVLPNDSEGHLAIFGGSGTGKTSALLIPSLRAWDSPFFAIDISGDISKNVPDANGKRITISPDDPSESWTVNIFHEIDVARSEGEKRELLEQLVNIIVDIPPNAEGADLYYLETARKIFVATMIGFYDVGMDFIEICQTTFFQSVQDLVKLIEATECEIAIGYIKPLSKENDKNIAGAKSALNKKIKLFADNDKMSAILRRPLLDIDGRIETMSFNPELLEDRQVFLKVPDSKQEYYSVFMHIVTGQILDHLSNRKFDRRKDKRILLALDEFASIGHFEILDPFRKFRKNGVNICILTQSLADIDLVYSEKERQVILDNAQYIAVLSARDNNTREYFSNLVGKRSTTKISKSRGRGGESVSESEQKEFAIDPDEWKQMNKNLIVIHPAGYVRLKKNFYYKDK